MGAIFSSKDVPKEPATKCKESVNELCRNFSWAQDAVSDLQALFDQRPIWSRSALVSHLQKDIKRERLSKILPFLAFYWLNGPWRALWNRYGYDPRQSAEGKRQTTLLFWLVYFFPDSLIHYIIHSLAHSFALSVIWLLVNSSILKWIIDWLIDFSIYSYIHFFLFLFADIRYAIFGYVNERMADKSQFHVLAQQIL